MVFEITIDRLKHRKSRIEKFIDSNLLNWIEEVGVPIVKQEAVKKGMQNEPVSKIHAEKDGFLKGAVRWGIKTSDGKPLDLFLEKGTDPHDIEVRFAKVLSDGESIFGRKVRHPGTRALNIFKDSEPLVLSAIKSKIGSETSRFMDATRVQ